MRNIQIGAGRSRPLWVVAVAVAVVIVATALVLPAAEPDQPPKSVTADAMDWWSVDSGGGRASGGTWVAISSIGQFDAGTLTAGSLTLDGGFVVTEEPGEPPLFADGFETGDFGAWSSVTP